MNEAIKKELDNWNYDQSVNEVKPMVMKWKTITVDIVKKLYIAREKLSTNGGALFHKSNSCNLARVEKTWTQYCDDIGLSRRTIHNWLEQFDVDTMKLLTHEELEKKKRDEFFKMVALVKKRISSGIVPDGWTKEAEKKYQATIDEEAYEERKKIAFEEQRKRYEEEINKEEIDEEIDEAEFNFSPIIDNLISEQKEKEKLKLASKEDNLTQEKMFFKIDYYLDSFLNINEKIQAAHNLIKYLKKKINEQQVHTIS